MAAKLHNYTLENVATLYPADAPLTTTFLAKHDMVFNDLVQIVSIVAGTDAKGLTFPNNIILNIAIMCTEEDVQDYDGIVRLINQELPAWDWSTIDKSSYDEILDIFENPMIAAVHLSSENRVLQYAAKASRRYNERKGTWFI